MEIFVPTYTCPWIGFGSDFEIEHLIIRQNARGSLRKDSNAIQSQLGVEF